MSDHYYWDEDLDPKTLKVTDLRKILLENDVSFSGQDKKSDLVKLFKSNFEVIRSNALRDREAVADSAMVVKAKPTKKKKGVASGEDKENAAVAMQDGPRRSRRISSATSTEGDLTSASKTGLGASSPFSDVNDFQKGNPRKRKSHERDDAGADEDGGRKKVRKKKTKVPKKKSSKDLVGEREKELQRSPIVSKVQSKRTPTKAEHHSLLIQKFESSSDESSPTGTPTRKKVLVFDKSLEKKLDVQDFSYPGRKKVAPDFTKLNVSPEFQAVLRNIKKDQSDYQKRPKSSAGSDMSTVESKEGLGDRPSSKSDSKDASKDRKTSAEATPKKSTPKKTKAQKQHQKKQEPPVLSKLDAKQHNKSVKQQSSGRGRPSAKKEINAAVATDNELLEDTEEDSRSQAVGQKSGFRNAFVFFLHALLKFLVFLAIVVPLLFGLWYREQRVQIGYCGHEVYLPTFANTDKYPLLERVEAQLQRLKPSCLPCPENAVCYPYMKIKCRSDYIVTPSVFSLYGLLPISDTCVKDSKRERLIAEVVQKSLELLRTKNAQVQCGEGEDDTTSGISQVELRRIFFESKAPWMNDEEFRDIWREVTKALESESEIVFRQVSRDHLQYHEMKQDLLTTGLQLRTRGTHVPEDSNNNVGSYDVPREEEHFHSLSEDQYFRSISKKYIGIRCQFERQVYRTYKQFTVIIWSTVVAVIAGHLLKVRIQRRLREQEMTEKLKLQVIEKLKTSAKSESSDSPKFLSTVQLRDVLLADIVDLKQKNQLWNKVVHKLESNNTNVKSMLMEVHGEIMKCWEWVGPLE